jgi:hypothetical protein
MNIDNGVITIKCNKYYEFDTYKCYNRSTSLCPLKSLKDYNSYKHMCIDGEVSLDWLDYITFNNKMNEVK